MEKLLEKRESESWESIKVRYPDNFVLILNPEYFSSPHLKSGILIYKSKIRKKVFEKATELKLPYITIQYTGGKRLDDLDENFILQGN